jgi:hypothetical protein
MYDAEGRVVSVVELDVADGVVQAIRSVVNPDKHGHIGPVSDVARLPEKVVAPVVDGRSASGRQKGDTVQPAAL